MSLYLGAYHFDGQTDALIAAYERLQQTLPADRLVVHICIERDGGLTVFDACPSKTVYDQFVRSREFLGALAAAGLPAPRTEGLGDIRVAHVQQAVRL